MPELQIQLYYKNVTAEIIDDEHGITKTQFKSLAEKTSPLISQLNEERKAGQTPYRDLPYNEKIVSSFMTAFKNIATISRREITRLRTRFTGRSRLVILVAVLLCLLVSFILYHQDFSMSKGLYTVGVSPDGPIITDSRFNTLTMDYPAGRIMLTRRSIDVYVNAHEAIYRNDDRSVYAAGA